LLKKALLTAFIFLNSKASQLHCYFDIILEDFIVFVLLATRGKGTKTFRFWAQKGFFSPSLLYFGGGGEAV